MLASEYRRGGREGVQGKATQRGPGARGVKQQQQQWRRLHRALQVSLGQRLHHRLEDRVDALCSSSTHRAAQAQCTG